MNNDHFAEMRKMVNMRTYTMQKPTNEMNVGINVGISMKNVGITGLIISCKAEHRIAQSYTMCYHIGYKDGE